MIRPKRRKDSHAEFGSHAASGEAEGCEDESVPGVLSDDKRLQDLSRAEGCKLGTLVTALIKLRNGCSIITPHFARRSSCCDCLLSHEMRLSNLHKTYLETIMRDFHA